MRAFRLSHRKNNFIIIPFSQIKPKAIFFFFFFFSLGVEQIGWILYYIIYDTGNIQIYACVGSNIQGNSFFLPFFLSGR